MGHPESSIQTPTRFLKLPQMLERLGISKSEAFRRIHSASGFPQPIRIGARCVVYSSAEVDAYMQECIAKRDQQRAA